MKRFTIRITAFLLSAVILTSMILMASAAPMASHIGIVKARGGLRLRSEANTSSTTLTIAPYGDNVVVLEKHGNWYKVNYNLQIGFMHKNYLRTTGRENVELGYGRVTGDRVNIRSGPGTSHSALTKANSGDAAYIIGVNAGWYKVIFQSVIGYIRSDYIDLTEIPYENQDSAKEPIFFKGGTSTGTPVSPSALNSVSAAAIIATARQYIGVP